MIHFNLPPFVVAVAESPDGMKPGRYFYVLHTESLRKVSRYVRRIETAQYKINSYIERWIAGERNWPEVGRAAELRDSKYVVLTPRERVKAWLRSEWNALVDFYGAHPGAALVHLP